jgi:predicted aspartyl protease
MLSLAVAMCGTVLLASTSSAAKEKPARPALEGYLKQLGYGVIPLGRSKGNQLTVEGRIAKRKLAFIVDTGCGITGLSTASGRYLKTPGELGIHLQDELINLPQDEVVLIPELTLGMARFPNQPARVENLQVPDTDGIIGMDFMGRQHCLLDCMDGRLYVRAGQANDDVRAALERTLRKNGYHEVKLKLESCLVFTVPVEINGHKVNLIVDTGASFTLLDDAAAKLCKLQWEPTPIFAAGVRSQMKSRVSSGAPPKMVIDGRRFPVRSLAIGKTDLSRWQVGDGTLRSDVDGLLGADLLVAGQVLLDVRQSKMWFLPEDVFKAVEKAKRMK